MAGSTSPEWSEERLRGLLGEAESLRLEFKSNRLFEKSVDDWKADLAKEISAFANSEGGTMVLGIEEDRGTPRRAERIEGLLVGRGHPVKSLKRYRWRSRTESVLE
jgi:predicted HTH transcriptional regulator